MSNCSRAVMDENKQVEIGMTCNMKSYPSLIQNKKGAKLILEHFKITKEHKFMLSVHVDDYNWI